MGIVPFSTRVAWKLNTNCTLSRISFFKTKLFRSLTPLKKEESLIHIVNLCTSDYTHHTPEERRCLVSIGEPDVDKEKRERRERVQSSPGRRPPRSGRDKKGGGRYKLPALQILMLHEYPAPRPPPVTRHLSWSPLGEAPGWGQGGSPGSDVTPSKKSAAADLRMRLRMFSSVFLFA